MNDLIQRIINAMIRQEGEPADALNPLNLRASPWLPAEDELIKYGFWYPSSRNEGIAGATHVLALHIAAGNSLTDFIAGHPGVYAGFAPGKDGNNDAVYIANIKECANIPDENATLWNYIAGEGV
jgi:hypothetical protein